MLNNLFFKRKSSINSESIMKKVFSESVLISEPNKQNISLSDDKKRMICNFIELSAEEYTNAGSKSVVNALDYTLNVKKEREKTNENYELALKRNILYYLYKWGYSKKLLKAWIEYNNIPDTETTERQLTTIRDFCLTENCGNKVVLKNGTPIQSNIEAIIKKYDNISPYEKRKDNLEFDYKYVNIRDSIIFNLILNIANNKQTAERLFKGIKADDAISYIESIVDFQTSSTLGNINFNI